MLVEQAQRDVPKIDKTQAKAQVKELQQQLWLLQHACFKLGIPVLVIVDGFQMSGRSSTTQVMSKRMDPRGYRVHAMLSTRVTEDLYYPFMHRYWTTIPELGKIVVFDGSYYTEVVKARLNNRLRKRHLEALVTEFESFERQLANSGMIVVKLFLYLSKTKQKERFTKLSGKESTSWMISSREKMWVKKYDEFYTLTDQIVEQTNFSFAPWQIINASSKTGSEVAVLTAVKKAVEERIREVTGKDVWEYLEDQRQGGIPA